jgi:hypothetical protein
VLVPEPVIETMSGPQTAVKRTESHTTAIASDAHISLRLSTTRHVGQLAGAAGSCDMLVMASSFVASSWPEAWRMPSGRTQMDAAP